VVHSSAPRGEQGPSAFAPAFAEAEKTASGTERAVEARPVEEADPRKVEIQKMWASIRQAQSEGVPLEELESIPEISDAEAERLGIKADALAKYRRHNADREARFAEIEFENDRSAFIDELGALSAVDVDAGKAKGLFANAQKFKIAMPDDVIEHIDESLGDTDLALEILEYNEGMVPSEITKGPARVVSGETVSNEQRR
jgi:hypothetical protein